MLRFFFFSIFFLSFFFEGSLYAEANLSKPAFNPLSSTVAVFIKDGADLGDEGLKHKLSTVLNSAHIEVWTIDKSNYSSIRFINGTNLYLTTSINTNNAILYKKGKPYMVINLKDAKLEGVINQYFDKLVYPDLMNRSKKSVEDSLEGIIYIKHSPKELFNESLQYDEEERIHLKKFRANKKAELKRLAQKLSIPYKELAENISEIAFPNGISISLDNYGGSVIIFKQGKNPQIFFVTDISLPILEQYFNK